MASFQGTNTYLIECSRENSKINIDDDINTNGSWSNETEFGLKRGDRISVEMVCANIRGSGTGAPTIEFSGQNVVVNGETKAYCDTKVLIEVFFTLNNNNTYSVGLPLIHPKGGINGRGYQANKTADYDNLVMPFNLNPRIPTQQLTNQINNYREINAGDGYVYPGLGVGGIPVPLVNQLPGGTTPQPPIVGAPRGGAFGTYQYKTENGGWLPPGTSLADFGVEGRLEAIRILPFAETQGAAQPVGAVPFTPRLYTDFVNGVLKGRTGTHVQNNFYPGNHVFISDEDPGDTGNFGCYWAGQIESLKGQYGVGANPAFGIGVLEVYFNTSNKANGTVYPGYFTRQGGGTGAPGQDWYGGARCAVYVGDLYLDTAGNPFCKFNVKAGSSQEGLINYDNLNMDSVPFDSPAVGATGRTFKPNGYHRGNNGHFLYARNTRIPQTDQNPNFNHYPDTEYDPTLVSGAATKLYTTTAGEYGGDLPVGASFGYRNANIVEENNNDPYIFMRNDHFGAGRLGMNGEKMPKAEPMTAFVYVTIKELLQDVNSLTAIINERLQESLTGIGNTTPQTNSILLSSIENPDGRKVASNVVPYYNKTGFYDKFVTANSQDTIMKQSINAQFRNWVTDVIPIKSGGTVKINPANGTSGRDQLACNYGKQYGGFVGGVPSFTSTSPSEKATQAELDNIKKNTYLREIETSELPSVPAVAGEYDLMQINGFNGWANPFYGNMATADLYKYLLGDRWANLPVHPLNNLTGDNALKSLRQVGKAIIMNTQFLYKTVNFPYPAGTNEYLQYLSNFPNQTPKPLDTTILFENQLIYTNIEFPLEDDDDGTWAALAKQMRRYETYFNITDSAPTTYKDQLQDQDNWIFDGDIGMTDDRSTAQLRTMVGQPTYHPPNVYPDTGATGSYEARYSGNRPAFYDWLANPEPEAVAVTATNSAYGVTTSNFNTPTPGRTVICPTTSHEIFAGVSATGNQDYELKYRMMKQLGRIKMKSRFNPKFLKTMKNYRGNPIYLASALPPDSHNKEFLAANTTEEKVNTAFMQELDLGFYPYYRACQEYDLASNSMVEVLRVFCAIAVGTEYNPDYSQISTINMGCLVWGNQIGISNSFYDNHAIIPMNNDQVKRSTALTATVVTPEKWETIGFIRGVDNFSNTLPAAPGTLAYTTPSTTPAFADNIYDFSIDRQTSPWIQSNGKVKYRVTYSDMGVGSGLGTITGTWEQSSNLQAAAVLGYQWISGDSAFTDLPGAYSPGAVRFAGFQLNAAQNTTTDPWLLTSPAPYNAVNGFPAWRGFPVFGTAPVPDPNQPTSTIASYDGQPGSKQIGYTNTAFPAFGSIKIEIYTPPGTATKGDPIEPNLGLEPNKVNYVWTGATKPTFQYDANKGRCEFIQLQDDNILNVKSIPYAEGTAAKTSAASVGTKAAIINSQSEDAVYSRNTVTEDISDPLKCEPVSNSGIRAEISSVGIYNIFLCPETYEPPATINLSSYWNNDLASNGNYWSRTEENRAKIIEGCIEASESNWTGSLFSRLGFQSHRELLPAYGKQKNRFNPNTYNTTQPALISKASRPLILCNAIDNSIMPALNTYFNFIDTSAAVADQINGVPMYSNGFLNNESVSIDVANQALTATSPPILSTSPFLLIESDICQTNWRSGRTQQNVLFYLMKNYQASSFIYGYGSSYTHTVNQDRNLSLINTAFRDPITGRLQKCSNNSTIVYKIERDIVIPAPQTDVMGVPLNIEAPESREDELLQQVINNTSRGGGNTGEGGTSGEKSGGIKGHGGGSGVINRQVVDADIIANQPAPGLGELQAGLQTGSFTSKVQAFNTRIAPALGVDPAEADIVSFLVQQILQTYPLDLVYSGGQLQPEAYTSVPEGNGNDEVGDRMIRYVLNTIDEMGGLEKVFEFYEDPGVSGTEKLTELINRTTLNDDGELVALNADFNSNSAVATFQIAGAGAQSLAEISSAILRFYEDPENPGTFVREQPNSQVSMPRVQMIEQMAYLFSETLTQDGVTLSDPMGEFTGVPFSQAGRLNEMVSVERSQTIPTVDGFPEVERGRSRAPRDAFSPYLEDKKSTGETKESKSEPTRRRNKEEMKSAREESLGRRSSGRLRGNAADRRRENQIRVRARRRGGATTPADSPSGDDRRDAPRYMNTPVRMRSVTPTRDKDTGRLKSNSMPPPASRAPRT